MPRRFSRDPSMHEGEKGVTLAKPVISHTPGTATIHTPTMTGRTENEFEFALHVTLLMGSLGLQLKPLLTR